jgi:hypothetical protein
VPSSRTTLRSLFSSRAGRLALLGITIVTLVACFVYLGSTGTFLAIPDLLFFGLALPIYAGWKKPRHLFVYGLAAMLISVPITSVLAVNYVYAPFPPQDSATAAGVSNPILTGAVATPYAGATGATYSFTVTVDPANVPANASPPMWVELWVSTCPGATGPSDPYCSSGYPLLEANETFPDGLNSTQVIDFQLPINGSNIWSWEMGTAYYAHWNASNAAQDNNLTWVFLGPVQGPVVGPYLTILGIALEAFLVAVFIPAGIVFMVGLLGYMWLKAREARRKALEEPPAGPPGAPSSPGAPLGAAPAGGIAASKDERSCPNCKAVVYPNEATCWKCGAPLTGGAGASAPLASK